MKIITDFEKNISLQICSFLKSHVLISKNALEKEIGLSQGQLVRSINEEKKIPSKYLFSLMLKLSGYGLKIDGYRLERDENTPTLFLIKDFEEAPEITEVEPGVMLYKQKQYRSIACDLSDFS